MIDMNIVYELITKARATGTAKYTTSGLRGLFDD